MKTRLLFGIFLILMFAVSCNRKKEINNERAISYNDYIYTVALSYPHKFNQYYFDGEYASLNLGDDSAYYKDIVEIKKTSYSNKTKLLMNFHAWGLDCHSYPNILIYVTDKKKFNYVIPFFDEQYYRMQSNFIIYFNDTLFYKQLNSSGHYNYDKNGHINEEDELMSTKNRKIIEYTENAIAFPKHLNEILYHLYPKSYVFKEQSMKEIKEILNNRFENKAITTSVLNNFKKIININYKDINELTIALNKAGLLKTAKEMDLIRHAYEIESVNKIRTEAAKLLLNQIVELIGLKEIKLKDTTEINRNRKLYNNNSEDWICSRNFSKNIDTMINRMKTTEYQYYKTLRGEEGYWEFEIKNDEHNRCKIYARIINSECYSWMTF